MELVIRGDKIKVTEAMKNYIEEKVGKLDKYIEDSSNIRANVLVKVKNHNQIIEIKEPSITKLVFKDKELIGLESINESSK
mgnify:CR=1 FL=1